MLRKDFRWSRLLCSILIWNVYILYFFLPICRSILFTNVLWFASLSKRRSLQPGLYRRIPVHMPSRLVGVNKTIGIFQSSLNFGQIWRAMWWRSNKVFILQCTLDLVTLNLVTTCDLVTIFQRPFFNLLQKIIRFSDIMRFSDSFCGNQTCH